VIKSIFVWFVELTIECVLGAYIAFLAFGPNGDDSGVLENVREDIGPVLLFILVSGYFATRAWFEVLRPRADTLAQMCTNVALFCLHAGGFLFLIEAEVERIPKVLLLGAAAVIFTSLMGAGLRKSGFKPRYG
jgi:hypothetical protein